MLLLKCEVCNSKKLEFIKGQVSGFFSSFGINTSLIEIPLEVLTS